MNKEDVQEVVVHIRIDQSGLDELLRKLERMNALTKEANSLAGELASEERILKLRIES